MLAILLPKHLKATHFMQQKRALKLFTFVAVAAVTLGSAVFHYTKPVEAQSGQVIENQNLGCYSLNGKSNVTLRNVTINCPPGNNATGHALNIQKASNIVVENSTIGFTNGMGPGFASAVYIYQSNNVTIKNSKITSFSDATVYINNTDNTHLEGNTIVTPPNPSQIAGGRHADVVQITAGNGIYIGHNTMSMPVGSSGTGSYVANILGKADLGPVTDLVIEHNKFSGGQYSVYCIAGSSPTVNIVSNTAPANALTQVPDCTVHNNVFSKTFGVAPLLINNVPPTSNLNIGGAANSELNKSRNYCNVYEDGSSVPTRLGDRGTQPSYPSYDNGNCDPGPGGGSGGGGTPTPTAAPTATPTTAPTSAPTATPTTNPTTDPCTQIDEGSGQVSYDVDIPQTGEYRVWVRGYVSDINSDSVTLTNPALDASDDQCNIVLGDGGSFANQWTWIGHEGGRVNSPALVSFDSGEQSLVLTGRGYGFRVDTVLLTTDTSCTPTGQLGTNCLTNVSATPTPSTTTSTSATPDPTSGATPTPNVPSGSSTPTPSSTTTPGISATPTPGTSSTPTPNPTSGATPTPSTSGTPSATPVVATEDIILYSTNADGSSAQALGGKTVRDNEIRVFADVDNPGAVSSMVFSIDGRQYRTEYNPPFTLAYTQDINSVGVIPELGEGQHTVSVLVRFNDGSSDLTQTVTFTIDGTAGNPNIPDDGSNPSPSVPVPINITININVDVVVLKWDPGTSDGLTSAGYNVYRNNELIGTTLVPQFVDTTAVPEQTYDYRVRAVEDDGSYSELSDPVTVTTPKTHDDKVEITNVSVDSTDGGEAVVSFNTNQPANGVVEFGNGDSLSSRSLPNTGPTTDHAIVIDQAQLAAGAAYNFRVRATDTNGDKGVSEVSSFQVAQTASNDPVTLTFILLALVTMATVTVAVVKGRKDVNDLKQ